MSNLQASTQYHSIRDLAAYTTPRAGRMNYNFCILYAFVHSSMHIWSILFYQSNPCLHTWCMHTCMHLCIQTMTTCIEYACRNEQVHLFIPAQGTQNLLIQIWAWESWSLMIQKPVTLISWDHQSSLTWVPSRSDFRLSAKTGLMTWRMSVCSIGNMKW